eukprot:556862-Hanusia_phi.AAC.3
MRRCDWWCRRSLSFYFLPTITFLLRSRQQRIWLEAQDASPENTLGGRHADIPLLDVGNAYLGAPRQRSSAAEDGRRRFPSARGVRIHQDKGSSQQRGERGDG